jgi:CBS-domain-containing membrane protein
VGFTRADLDAVLAARGEFLDIEEDDLEAILVAAELRAYSRRFGDVRCSDIMSRDVVAVRPASARPMPPRCWRATTSRRYLWWTAIAACSAS